MISDSSSEYSLQIEQTDYKSQNLIYEEPGYRLVIYLEMCRGEEFYWGGISEDLENWTVPAGETISPEKREQIIERIYEWSRVNKTPIKIRPATTKEQMIQDYEQLGCTIVHNSEKSFTIRPPLRAQDDVAPTEQENFLTRAVRWFKT